MADKLQPSKNANEIVPLPGSLRRKNPNARRIRDIPSDSPIELTLTLRGPALPSFGKPSPHDVGGRGAATRYSSSQTDAERVCKVMQSFGFKVIDVNLAARSIRIKGNVDMANRAFKPRLALYENSKQGVFRDRSGGYGVPSAIAPIVTAVIGLSERAISHRGLQSKKANRASNVAQSNGPSDLEQIYDFPTGTARGQKIAIAEFGGGYIASDLRAYCRKYAKPMPKVVAVSVNAPAYTLRQIKKLPRSQRADELDCSEEVMMDCEIIAGLCPEAEIRIYFATFDQKGWVDLLGRVIADRPVSLSISWGSAEDSGDWSAAAREAINERLALAAAHGITICTSSGDDGAGDGVSGRKPHVEFPSSSPYVLSVGGTMLKTRQNKQREIAWWESPGRRTKPGQDGGASGGGVSRLFKRPAWQKVRVKSLNEGAMVGRVVPDVSAFAAYPFYDLVLLGKDYAKGAGTSASAPLWAALVARINQKLPRNKRQRFLTPLLYTKGKDGKSLGFYACHDITEGNNKSKPLPAGYAAKRGYDAVTGWGSPNGKALLRALKELK